MSADKLRAGLEPEHVGYDLAGLLDLDADLAHGRGPAALQDFRDVDLAFVDVRPKLTGQGGHEGIDLLDDERSLAGPRLDQAAGGEQLDGVAHRVA